MSQPHQEEQIDGRRAYSVDSASEVDLHDKQIGVVSAEAGRSIAGWTLWVGILG